jgi:acetyl esterase/lipase
MFRTLLLMLTAGFALTASAQTPPPKAGEPKAKAPKTAAPTGPAPTMADVKYGEHPRQVLDFYQAKSDKPTPLVFAIHGGGWVNGDKSLFRGAAERFNKAGISMVSINYRMVTQADEAGVKPPVQWPVGDAARALQFVRSKAKEWNIDKERIGATGGSAGGCSSLWLLYHDDLANPKSEDPIARESTRIFCAAVNGPQTTLDPKILREWIPNARYGGHAFGIRTKENRDGAFQEYFEKREPLQPLINEFSPLFHVTKGDPPVFMEFKQDKPPVKGEAQADPTHTALLGLILMEKLKETGGEGIIVYPGHEHEKYKTSADYLIDRLKQ